MDDELNNFLTHWYGGFIHGLEQVDAQSQETILRACGLACAQSYTAQVFKEAWQQSPNLAGFLSRLAGNFPDSIYERIDDHTLCVRYQDCACDLVRRGWVQSPILCTCSQNNLQQNFQAALGKPVRVVLRSSILGGAKECVFEVLLEAE